MGDPNISENAVLKVSMQIGFHRFIDRLEKSYETNVGEMGKKLSFGQRRMITILRVLCRNPKILLLDEITSNLDSYTEILIHQLLSDISKEKVCLMITHRHNDLKHAKKVFYI